MKKQTIINFILLAVMLIITARYLAAGWNRILFNSNSAEGDQGAFLQLGLDAREQGVITDGKRNPLYPLVLATFAHRDWTYFTWAKIFNFLVGLATIWATFLIGRRLFNAYAGVLAAYLLSINVEFIFHATFALAESLLILSFLLAWFAMVRALQQPERLKVWVLGGLLAGLAYLVKGTGPLLAVCFIFTATLLHGYKIWVRRVFWGFVIGFCLAALPLLLYNWAAFGSPIFNSAINNVMWMDDATEKYVADPATLPTFSSYIRDKSLGEAWERISEGLLTMRYYYARLLWPSRSLIFDAYFQRGWIDYLFIATVVLLLVFWKPLLPVFKRYRASITLTAVLVGLFYLLFGWYIAISPFPTRFILPLAPMILLLPSAGAVGLLQTFFTAPKIPRWTKATGAVAVLLLALYPLGWFAVTGYLIVQGSQRNAFSADAKFNDFIEQPLLWVRAGHQSDPPVTVMEGPTHMLPLWRHSDRLNFIRTPVAQAGSTDELEAFMKASNVTYVVVDGEMVSRMGKENAAEWGIHKREDGRIEVDDYPPEWALGFVGPEMPCQWCVFRRLSAPPAIQRVDYRLGDSFVLFGHELETAEFRPGGHVVVTLYWAVQQSVSADYTVFTQLLGPDFQLHGQMDRQPLSGHWPTSRWQPGQKFVDKFVLSVDEATLEGEYVLLVGLYDSATGQRIPAFNGEQRLHDDAIPLGYLSIPQPEAAISR